MERSKGRGCLPGCLAIALCAWPLPLLAYNPAAGDFSKAQPADIRILSYNTQQNFIADASRDAAFNRVLAAIRPDIVVFEEVAVAVSAGAVTGRLDSLLPSSTGSWQANDGLDDGWSRVVVASRYPLLLRRKDTIPNASTRGVNLCLVDLPRSYATDLYLLGVHLKAGGTSSDDVKRQRSADAMASWMGDARRPGGYITLAADTPMIAVGDFNLVGGPQPEATLITGDIVDNSTFGPDVKGDWDISDLADLKPADPFTGDIDTWSSNYTNPNSRLDRFIYTDSVAGIGARFVLNTLTMSSTARSAAGLQQDDTTSSRTADHLPIVMDLRVAVLNDCNENGVDDMVDISAGTSGDCNSNGVPDECEPDGDGDSVPDGCDNCPAVRNPGQADSDGNGLGDACQCAEPFADADLDGDVDQSDFGRWQLCTSEVNLPAAEECLCFDRDGNRFVDGLDLAAFAVCISGASQPADPTCDDVP